jgi:hypothetical protein
MNCPYSDEELEYWDSVTNPMGKECESCDDFECEHNNNLNNPERYDPFFDTLG